MCPMLLTVQTVRPPQQEHWNSIGMNWKDSKNKGNETMGEDKSFKSSYMKGKRETG